MEKEPEPARINLSEGVEVPVFKYTPERAAELDQLLVRRNAALREVIAPASTEVLPFEVALERRNTRLREIFGATAETQVAS